jgi:enoyl-CoA hydratase/3-hydroxyacyl-CoA dehydrogenase
MKVDGIDNITVFGAGTMGHGIAELCAQAGYNVTIVDVKDEFLQKAIEKIKWSLSKLEQKGKLSESADKIMKRIKTTTNPEEGVKNADYVIEAIIERFDIKSELFSKIDKVAKRECIFATNTSTLPITELAAATQRPDKFIGLHFFNPPTLMPLVEIIKGEKTSNETIEITKKIAKSIRKDYVIVEKDVPGFLVNRINLRVFMEAIRMIERGEAEAEEIDATARYRLGMPMGILEVVDFSGLDVVYYAGMAMKERGYNFVPSKLVEEKFKSGEFGMKTGKGFYTYPKAGGYFRPKISRKKAYKVSPVKLIAPAVNEAAWLLRNGVATKEDIEKSMKLGMNYSKGLLESADAMGIDRIVNALRTRKEETGYDEYEPDELLLKMLEESKLGKKTGNGFFTYSFESADFGKIHYEKRGDVAYIIMRRAEKLNALNEEMWKGIRDAIQKANGDAEVRSIIITGEGKAFSSGDDIAEMFSFKGMADSRDFFEKVASPTIEAIINSEKPIISAVNGFAFGGGMELNLLFDIVVASDQAIFALPEARIGALPPLASSIGIALLGKRFIEKVITGEAISAEEAQELGLVNVVCPPDQLEDVAREFAELIPLNAPRSIASIRKIIGSLFKLYSPALDVAIREILLVTAMEDFKVGTGAFIMKQKPEWKGR